MADGFMGVVSGANEIADRRCGCQPGFAAARFLDLDLSSWACDAAADNGG